MGPINRLSPCTKMEATLLLRLQVYIRFIIVCLTTVCRKGGGFFGSNSFQGLDLIHTKSAKERPEPIQTKVLYLGGSEHFGPRLVDYGFTWVHPDRRGSDRPIPLRVAWTLHHHVFLCQIRHLQRMFGRVSIEDWSLPSPSTMTSTVSPMLSYIPSIVAPIHQGK
jgi:hypothetical protein